MIEHLRLLDGWDARLNAAIEAARRKPFQWGVHDCALFATDCALAMTGIDMADGLRGTYDSLQGAAAAMKRICGGGIEQLVEHFAEKHGAREVPRAFAQRHAITLLDDAVYGEFYGPCLGCCIGRFAAHLHPKKGLCFVPMKMIRRTWMVR